MGRSVTNVVKKILSLVLAAALNAFTPAIAETVLQITFRDYGSVTVELWPETAPLACESVSRAATLGKYDGRRIERLEPGYVLQPLFFDGDDPVLDALLPLEINEQIAFERGVVGMTGVDGKASAGQFFITLGDAKKLNGRFTAIGRVTDGWETIEAIEKTQVAEGQLEEDGEVYQYHYPASDIIVENVAVRVTESFEANGYDR